MKALRKSQSQTPRLQLVSSVAKSFTEMTDEELVIACQRQQKGALDHLLKRHKRTILGLLYKLAPDWRDTSDIEQEVYIRVWRYIGQLRNPASFKTWLCRIVTNLYYDELRSQPKQMQIISIDEPITSDDGTRTAPREIADTKPEPADDVLRDELSGVLTTAMSNIPERFRTAVVLRDIEGLSYEEIANLTGTELGTVKSRIARARTKILKQVTPYLKEAA